MYKLRNNLHCKVYGKIVIIQRKNRIYNFDNEEKKSKNKLKYQSKKVITLQKHKEKKCIKQGNKTKQLTIIAHINKTKMISKKRKKESVKHVPNHNPICIAPNISNINSLVPKLKSTFRQTMINSPIFIVSSEESGVLAKRRQRVPCSIASITKLINLLTCLQLLPSINVSLQTKFTVPKLSIKRSQSSAKIQQGDILTLQDLLYAMILPSGNDAAEVVAIQIGRRLIKARHPTDLQCKQFYIELMRKYAIRIGMKHTKLIDEKGFANNTSIAQQIMLLLKKVSQNQVAYIFLTKQSTRASVTDLQNKQKWRSWTTTNCLYGYGYYGKTGHAVDGSFNFAAIKKYKNKIYYICVLGSSSESGRFSDVLYLFNHLIKKYSK